jgi:hypothetical protein
MREGQFRTFLHHLRAVCVELADFTVLTICSSQLSLSTSVKQVIRNEK